jgi:hypothetical protein
MAGIRVGVDNFVRAETDRTFATVDGFDTPWVAVGARVLVDPGDPRELTVRDVPGDRGRVSDAGA